MQQVQEEGGAMTLALDHRPLEMPRTVSPLVELVGVEKVYRTGKRNYRGSGRRGSVVSVESSSANATSPG
jgi:hypothetical protein